jgi:pyruvate,orthophosphate dikinase
MAAKHIYAFGGGTADGTGDQKTLLGGKGAGLAEMSRLGIPVPPGFTLTTEVCSYYQEHDGSYPKGLERELAQQLKRLEKLTGQRFGAPENPLLVSVRSGAPVSMPGMMDTILNLGLSPAIVAAWITRGADERFVLDAWRRLLTMYGDVVLEVEHAEFEEILGAARKEHDAASDADLPPAALAAVAADFERLIARHGRPFPPSPQDQLWGAIGAVFASWNNRRAREYRRLNGISERLGTAVNVQAMVFGNRGSDCATGVAFTRNPATGEARVYGEYLVNAQGEDVVAGIRTPRPIVGVDGSRGLAEDFPQADRELRDVCSRLEHHYRDMQDVEFTIQHDKLYMLQTRGGKRTGPAAVRIAAELVAEGVLTPREALGRVKPQDLLQMLAPEFDQTEKAKAVAAGNLLAHGLPAGPGAASGRMVLTAERAAKMAAQGPVILVRAETSPEDIVGMHAAVGILTSRGGMTSHAAVVARGMGKPCLVGAGALEVDERAGVVRVGDRTVAEDDEISIDGTTGEVILGGIRTRASEVLRALLAGESDGSAAVATFRSILTWSDEVRRMRVRANADTPGDAAVARALGAEGIGLCRTEHMFFEEERIPWVRRMILADTAADRAAALAQLLPMQQKDFEGIFAALSGLPVTVRLLDPPLHEFLPHGEALRSLAKQMGVPEEKVAARAAALAEANPMLGHRGSRLGMTAPEIYEMQVEAIARAACVRARAGDVVEAEIMVPLVGVEQEMIRLRELTAATIARVFGEEKMELPVAIGTMIEVPRAALIAGRVALHADFFSFGTNDLTQMTYGYSRDDIGRFLPNYIETDVLPFDPFARIDEEGVGQLVRMACAHGRAARPDLHLGVCGEHGGDPDSVDFFDRAGLDYVSCSPYRVPIARLAAARATLAREREGAAAVAAAPAVAAGVGVKAGSKAAAKGGVKAGTKVAAEGGAKGRAKGRVKAAAKGVARVEAKATPAKATSAKTTRANAAQRTGGREAGGASGAGRRRAAAHGAGTARRAGAAGPGKAPARAAAPGAAKAAGRSPQGRVSAAARPTARQRQKPAARRPQAASSSRPGASRTAVRPRGEVAAAGRTTSRRRPAGAAVESTAGPSRTGGAVSGGAARRRAAAASTASKGRRPAAVGAGATKSARKTAAPAAGGGARTGGRSGKLAARPAAGQGGRAGRGTAPARGQSTAAAPKAVPGSGGRSRAGATGRPAAKSQAGPAARPGARAAGGGSAGRTARTAATRGSGGRSKASRRRT